MSINNIIKIAQDNSYASHINRKTFEIKKYDYIDFTKSRIPQLNLSLTPANYIRSIQEQWDSETEKFVPVQIQRMLNVADISLYQPVPFLGGEISISSTLRRNQTFYDNSRDFYFVSAPLNVSFYRNFLDVNNHKWMKRTEPIIFEEAQKRLIEENESIAIRALDYFFNLIIAKGNLNIAQLNLNYAKSYLIKADKMLEINSISLPEFMNLKLKKTNAEISEQKERILYENARLELCNFLDLPQKTQFSSSIPIMNNLIKIPLEQALNKFRLNNPDIITFSRKIIESEKKLTQAKAQMYDVEFKASLGLNQNKESLLLAYQNLLDKQMVSVSLNIPIVDWGETSRNIKKVKLNKEIIEIEAQKEIHDIELDLIKKIEEFNLTGEQILLLAQADTLARFVHASTQQRFLMGKATILDVNDSEKELQNARNNYMNQLKSYWIQYYTIRKLCLFDFEKNFDL